MKSHLLPEGFRDSLPELAKKEFAIIMKFVNFMEKNNYSILKPPLLEFEKSLFFLTKNQRNNNSFRVLDPISQKMMGLRSDMTTQIARIACGSLNKSDRPLRLSYFGEILKTKNNQLNISRQHTQIGAELIGVKKPFHEAEIINLVYLILKMLRIKNFSFSFSMPSLFDSICKDYKLNKDQILFLKERYENKNILGLSEISREISEVSSILIKCVGKLPINLKKLKSFKFPKNTQNEIDIFLNSMIYLKKNLPDISFNIDPIEIDYFGYHNGIMFKVYSNKLRELFNGGKYKVNNEDSIGFSGLIENLIDECLLESNKKRIYVSFSLLNIDRMKLIKKGFIVVNGKSLGKRILMEKNAKKNKCNYLLFNNKVIKI